MKHNTPNIIHRNLFKLFSYQNYYIITNSKFIIIAYLIVSGSSN